MMWLAAGLVFLLRSLNHKVFSFAWGSNSVGSAISLGLAMSVKWTALGFLGVSMVVNFARGFCMLCCEFKENRLTGFKYALYSTYFLSICIYLPVALYVAICAIHLQLLPMACEDSIFYGERFQSTLLSSSDGEFWVDPEEVTAGTANWFEKVVELNTVMLSLNSKADSEHPSGSRPQSWPFLHQGVGFLYQGNYEVMLIGNPMVWWMTTVLVLTIPLILAFRMRLSVEVKDLHQICVLLGCWAASYLPFFAIQRSMFTYHYLPALHSLCVLSGVVFDIATKRLAMAQRLILSAVIALPCMACYVFFSPLAYGTPLTDTERHSRRWLDGSGLLHWG
jgi:dolichyl-phosphate-mannose--protein O-mannosyl transferase